MQLTIEIIPNEQGQNSEEDCEGEDNAVEKAHDRVAYDKNKLSLTEVLSGDTVVVRRLASSTIGRMIHINTSTEKGRHNNINLVQGNELLQ